MDIEHYKMIIDEIMDFEIKMSTVTQSRNTLLELMEKREIILEMKEKVCRDIRAIELEYLNRRSNIRSEFECEENSSFVKKFFNKGASPAQIRARTMRHLESERRVKIHGYEEIKYTLNDLIEQIEDTMIEIYKFIKNSEVNEEMDMQVSQISK